MNKRLCLVAVAASLLATLSGCATFSSNKPTDQTAQATNKNPYRADTSEFADATWLPESSARPPLQLSALSLSTEEILEGGVHKFDGALESSFSISKATKSSPYRIVEKVTPPAESVLSFSTGSDRLYRNGKPVTNATTASVKTLPDGRMMVHTSAPASTNIAVSFKAFDVSGKEVRQLLRDINNQPTDLAWYVKKSFVFPKGSRVYLPTFWLGDDEIVTPSRSAFTGAKTMEDLVSRFNLAHSPFCISYVAFGDAHPYALSFPSVGKKLGTSGSFVLYPMDTSSNICTKKSNTQEATGTWKIRSIQGTTVMELTPESKVKSENIGVQPVNANAITNGFAEMVRGVTGKGKRAKTITTVVPVRILRNNQPIVDFRLRFNNIAADAVRKALADAVVQQAKDQQVSK